MHNIIATNLLMVKVILLYGFNIMIHDNLLVHLISSIKHILDLIQPLVLLILGMYLLSLKNSVN